MKMSENINELAKALSLAQGEMEGASKNAENPHLKNKYADISAIWEAVRMVLPKHGLAVSQVMCDDAAIDGSVCVESILMHTSGQWLASRCTLPVSKRDPQGYGSAITYARRYSLSALVGVVTDDDDDGEAATNGKSQQRQQSSQTQGIGAKQIQQQNPTPPQGTQPQQQAPPELHDLEAVQFDIVTCNTAAELTEFFKSLRLHHGHPQRDVIGEMCAKRKVELAPPAPTEDAASPNVEKLTAAQNKAIQTYYSNCGLDRAAKIEHLCKFFHRNIATTNDLTKDDASKLLEAFKQQEQAA